MPWCSECPGGVEAGWGGLGGCPQRAVQCGLEIDCGTRGPHTLSRQQGSGVCGPQRELPQSSSGAVSSTVARVRKITGPLGPRELGALPFLTRVEMQTPLYYTHLC